jgi:hypothetical protein
MKRRLFTIVTALSLLVIPMLSSCGRHHAREGTFVLPPRETPRSGPPVLRGSSASAVVYAPYANPDPLTPGELDATLRYADEFRPEGREVWFILVLFNRPDFWNVVIYYTPDEVRGRMRKGRCMSYGTLTERALRLPPGLLGGDEPPGRREARRRYVQVIDDATKGDDVGYVGGLGELPFAGAMGMPGMDPLPLSDDDLIAVVDLASGPSPMKVGDEMPVHRIDVQGDRVLVYFGWVVAPLYGGGRFREVRRSAGQWIVLPDEGIWVS